MVLCYLFSDVFVRWEVKFGGLVRACPEGLSAEVAEVNTEGRRGLQRHGYLL